MKSEFVERRDARQRKCVSIALEWGVPPRLICAIATCANNHCPTYHAWRMWHIGRRMRLALAHRQRRELIDAMASALDKFCAERKAE